jgi:glycerol-3-phosphate dehydrogenase
MSCTQIPKFLQTVEAFQHNTVVITRTTRQEQVSKLREGDFDVLILGGGVNGAGLARDLALRNEATGSPLRIALLEKNHFGSGTSGKNSHLIHGGLRYLKYFDFKLVREALHERSVLLNIAPHLVEPLPMLLPMKSLQEKLFYGAGLMLYDMLAGRHNIGKRRWQEGGAVYYDARVKAARLVLENALEAIENGVAAANYVEVLEYTRAGAGWKVRWRDSINGEESSSTARTLVDATGPWIKSEGTRLVRGSHLIYPRLLEGATAITHFEASGRIVFFVPFGTEDCFTLVGTTEADHEQSPDQVHISADETAYLAEVTRRVLGTNIAPISSFSSLRALVRDESRSATSTSREHRIWRDEKGIVRITGGKYTTYRLMAEEAADLVCPQWKHLHPSTQTALRGNTKSKVEALHQGATALSERFGAPTSRVRSYIANYGIRAQEVLALPHHDGSPAQLVYAVDHELATHLVDVLFVSTTWGYERHWKFEEVHDYASQFGARCGWTAERVAAETEGAWTQCAAANKLDMP